MWFSPLPFFSLFYEAPLPSKFEVHAFPTVSRNFNIVLSIIAYIIKGISFLTHFIVHRPCTPLLSPFKLTFFYIKNWILRVNYGHYFVWNVHQRVWVDNYRTIIHFVMVHFWQVWTSGSEIKSPIPQSIDLRILSPLFFTIPSWGAGPSLHRKSIVIRLYK